jgi:hypothetical protein
MDALTKIVAVTIIIAFASLGVVVVFTVNSIDQANIPYIERGTVQSKQAPSGNSADYSVTLTNGQILYIKNDTSTYKYIVGKETLLHYNDSSFYNSIMENKTYVFDGLLDYKNKMVSFQQVTEINDTTTQG